jgi:hypothetical protein
MTRKLALCLQASIVVLSCGRSLVSSSAVVDHHRFPTTIAEWSRGAMLFGGLGDRHRAITTSSSEAQKYFDQGLRLMWAFNHDEATRSFAKAAELDPRCASCFWGVSLTVGPNYNLPFLSEARAKVARRALLKAAESASHSSTVERALIAALAKRYPTERPLDAQSALPVLTAYATALKEVAAAFPADLDVQTLYAESLMNLRAWKLWTPIGEPAPGTQQIVAILEAVWYATRSIPEPIITWYTPWRLHRTRKRHSLRRSG